MPDMPFPGDDQGSTIYSALAGLESAAGELIAKAEEASGSATGASPAAKSTFDSSQSNGTSPGDPNSKGPVPHRWVIVGAMAVAFVLCNMDKVPPPLLFCIGLWLKACILSVEKQQSAGQ